MLRQKGRISAASFYAYIAKLKQWQGKETTFIFSYILWNNNVNSLVWFFI